MSKSIAIVGAGMAGLSCAMALGRQGFKPVLFDKGRGPGGRMAARRVELGEETVRFDHGAQYFTARDPRFVEAVEGWTSAGFAAPWPEAGEDAFVGTPAMNAPIKQMAQFFTVEWGTRIDAVMRDELGWNLRAGSTAYRVQNLVCAIPAEQAAALLESEAPDFAARAASVRSRPCWALMVRFDGPLALPDIFRGSDVAWAARNGSKPGRGGGEDWVIHASPAWSQENLERDGEEIASRLLAAFFAETGAEVSAPVHRAAHRWRYAMVEKSDGPEAAWDAERRVGICGDWLSGPRVENAFLSGHALAGLIAA